MNATTYTKLFPARMAAAKLTKKHGVKYIVAGPSAVDGIFTVELEVPAPVKAKRAYKPRASNKRYAVKVSEVIMGGEANYEQQVEALWQFANLTENGKLQNYLTGMPREYLSMIIGGAKTRWGAIGNVRAAMETV